MELLRPISLFDIAASNHYPLKFYIMPNNFILRTISEKAQKSHQSY